MRKRPGCCSLCSRAEFLTLVAALPGFQSSVSRSASSSRLLMTQVPGPFNPAVSFVPSAQSVSGFLQSLISGLSPFSSLAS